MVLGSVLMKHLNFNCFSKAIGSTAGRLNGQKQKNTLVIQRGKKKFCQIVSMQITYLMLMDQYAQEKKEDAQNNFGKS